jgi:hypothetical protein
MPSTRGEPAPSCPRHPQGTAAIRAISAHKPGPSAIQSDGHPAHMGLRGLRVCKGATLLLSGGADGLVRPWLRGAVQLSV